MHKPCLEYLNPKVPPTESGKTEFVAKIYLLFNFTGAGAFIAKKETFKNIFLSYFSFDLATNVNIYTTSFTSKINSTF